MTDTTTAGRPTRPHPDPGGDEFTDPARTVDWRRLRQAAVGWAMAASFLGALGKTLGTVVAGSLAEGPTRALVWLLALCVVGAAVLDTVGRTVWAAVVDRAEGRLREDLLDAALRQPLSALNEQAVGEILDRVDDDTHEVGTLLRRQVWDAVRTVFAALPMWVVAGLTWWPAWFLFPRVRLRRLPRHPAAAAARSGGRKVVEEMAWTDHAAVIEEGIAGRDDLRTSLGQAHVVRRVRAAVGRRPPTVPRLVSVETADHARAGVLLHALLAGIAPWPGSRWRRRRLVGRAGW